MKNKKHIVIAATSIVLVAVACIVIVQAYLYSPKKVQNDLIPANITCRVDEVFETDANGNENKNVKETVTVANTGTHDAYIRVIAVTYWQDTKGNVVEKQSEDLNLESIVDTNNWIIGKDNMIYYKTPVPAGGSTADLLADGKNVKVIKTASKEEGFGIFEYYQVIEFIAEAIQTKPATAVTESWGVTLNGTTIQTVPTQQSQDSQAN